MYNIFWGASRPVWLSNCTSGNSAVDCTKHMDKKNGPQELPRCLLGKLFINPLTGGGGGVLCIFLSGGVLLGL